MSYSEIYFFVEGPDDEKFIRAVVKPAIDKRHCCFLYKKSRKSTKKIKEFLRSIQSMVFANYLFIEDINRSPCVTAKKQALRNRYEPRLDENRIIVVVKEIESWYLAGLDNNDCERLGIRIFPKTDNITKEQFNELIPGTFRSRIDFMAEVLKRFSLETAKQKNKSFDYFMSRI